MLFFMYNTELKKTTVGQDRNIANTDNIVLIHLLNRYSLKQYKDVLQFASKGE